MSPQEKPILLFGSSPSCSGRLPPLSLAVLIALLWLGPCSLSAAHLLNMTQATVSVSTSGEVSAVLQLDLTKASGGGEHYYVISQLQQPLRNDALRDMWRGLQEGVQLRHKGNLIHWQMTKVQMPNAPQQDFTSGLAWPMTTVALSAQLPQDFVQGALTLTFAGSFKFEEPIALALSYAKQRKLGRWLVRNQQSPAFYFDEQLAPGPSLTTLLDEWRSYLWQGVLHIVPQGWDHTLFVIGLLLGAVAFKSLIMLITAFTLAHSITLIMATYGAIVAPGAVVELLIAASIVWIGIENRRGFIPSWRRFTVVFAFGLLHGLGFAQALQALGLPARGYVGALLSFNLGIEIAQLAIVVVLWWCLQRCFTATAARIRAWGSLIIALVAMYWVVERALALL